MKTGPSLRMSEKNIQTSVSKTWGKVEKKTKNPDLESIIGVEKLNIWFRLVKTDKNYDNGVRVGDWEKKNTELLESEMDHYVGKKFMNGVTDGRLRGKIEKP